MTSMIPKPTIRVLLLEGIHPSAGEMLRGEGYEVESLPSALKHEELLARIAQVEVLGIRSKTRVTADVIAAAPHLLAVGAFCIGTNQVDLHAAKVAGVPVFNAPFSNTRSVAELVIGELVCLARQLGDRSREVHAGVWRKVAAGCHELRGKTLGIVGYGHIGSQVGVLAEAMGMRVISYDIRTTMAIGNARPTDTLGDLLAEADFVTLHVPETPQTKNLIGAAELSQMKTSAHLINASRGTVVDVDALADSVREGRLAGAAIDVFPEEPEANGQTFTSVLQGLPNVLLTPHIGGSTAEAQAAIGREVATSLCRYVALGTTAQSVNFPNLELAQAPGTERVLNVHKNVPGVLRDINRIVSERGANIRAQLLGTDADTGYLIMDIDDQVASQVGADIARLTTSVRTRVVA